MKKKYIFIISILIIFIDQIIKKMVSMFMLDGISKNFIGQVIKLSKAYNTGAAFSFGSNNTIIIIVINIILIVGLVYFVLKNYNKVCNLNKISFALIIGGGISNLVDRIFRGYVVDYLSFNIGSLYFPIFNFADVCIVLSIIFIFVHMLKEDLWK